MHESQAASIVLGSLDSLLEGFQVVSFEYRYLFVNETAARHGRRRKDELLGRTMSEAYPGIENTPMFAMLCACMRDRTPQRMENEFEYPDETRGWFELVFQPVPEGVCILSSDISERKRAQKAVQSLEDQLRHAQKMEAVGRLACGVAHDLNNIVTVVQLNCALLADVLPEESQAHDDLREIRKAGERAAALTKQLLIFGRRQPRELHLLDLNDVVTRILQLLKRLMGHDAQLEFIPGEVYPVLADGNHLGQVLMNLVANARDAMPQGGKVTIETTKVRLDGGYADAHLGVAHGDYVMLAVTDTGAGMEAETQARIFEPFFTTKPAGKGTGLGLSTVYGIVKQSGGHIWVYSEPGQGTTFKIYLPRHAAGAPEVAAPAPEPVQYQGSETILLVEDDPFVRAAVVEVLVKQGYHVLTSRDATEASNHIAQTPVDLLLTDVNIPGMNGVELARLLRREHPRLRVLCMSGYTDEVAIRSGMVSPELAFLQKPLTPESLLRKLRQVLDQPEVS